MLKSVACNGVLCCIGNTLQMCLALVNADVKGFGSYQVGNSSNHFLYASIHNRLAPCAASQLAEGYQSLVHDVNCIDEALRRVGFYRLCLFYFLHILFARGFLHSLIHIFILLYFCISIRYEIY